MDWKTFHTSQIEGSRPRFPPLAAATNIQGSVLIRFVVTVDGTPTDLTVLSGHPLLVQSALDAVRTWRFKPTIVGTSPAEVETVAIVQFFLPGNDPASLIASARKGVEKHPDSAKAHKELANKLLIAGEAKEAVEEFQKVISLEPQDGRNHFDLARALVAQSNPKEAIEEFRAGLALKPKETAIHFDIAEAMERTDDLDGAVAEYRLGLQSEPKDSYQHSNFAALLIKRKEWDAAIAELKPELRNEIAPNAHYLMGLALEGKGDLLGAKKEFEETNKEFPHDQRTLDALNRVSQKLNP